MQTISINNKVVGVIEGDKYISERNTKSHFYFKGGGYPISNSILKVLKEKGVKTIVIKERGVRAYSIYEATLEKYNNAVLIKEGGFESQRCVPLKEMSLIRRIDLNG